VDSKTKNRITERIRRALTLRLREQGFARGKPTFWVRPRDHVLEFIHLHLYRSDSAFRVHLGIRVLNDEFDTTALNGPDSHSFWAKNRPVYDLDFSEEQSSIDHCANEIARFCSEVGEPWFYRLASPEDLLALSSPLREAERALLKQSLEGNSNAGRVQHSRLLLGVA
jgi:hypothetical protein